MKIALVHKRLDLKGGTERDLYQTAEGLRDLGHEVHLFAVNTVSLRLMARWVTSFRLSHWGGRCGRWQTARAQSDDLPQKQPILLTGEQDEYPLGYHLEILEDPGGELTIAEVSSPAYDSRFTPSQEDVPNYGFTNNAYWVRIRLDNETNQTDEWQLEVGYANMHYVDLYTPLPGGEGFTVKQTGALRPVSTRDILNPNLVFDLTAPGQAQQTYYLRFQNGASMTLPLTLWSQDAFSTETQQKFILQGICFGILLVLLVYNIFLLFSLREASYLYIVIFIASLLILEATYTGYLQVYVLPAGYYFLTLYFLPLAFSLMFGSLVLFMRCFSGN